MSYHSDEAGVLLSTSISCVGTETWELGGDSLFPLSDVHAKLPLKAAFLDGLVTVWKPSSPTRGTFLLLVGAVGEVSSFCGGVGVEWASLYHLSPYRRNLSTSAREGKLSVPFAVREGRTGQSVCPEGRGP